MNATSSRPFPLTMFAASFTLGVLLFSASLRAQAVDDPRGRYEFSSTDEDGRPFSGTLHITEFDGVLGGRVITTLRPPFPMETVEVDGNVIAVTARTSGADWTLRLRLTMDGEDFTGEWTLRDQEGALEGTKFLTDEDDNLRPVDCRASGVDALAKCATYHVWEDREAETGRKIPLNIVILPARSTEGAPDPLFAFAGGPGQASTDGAGGNAQRYEQVLEHRDVVMVDQRGTGGSNGLACGFASTQKLALVLLAWDVPMDELAACRQELSERADLSLYHTSIAVDDINEVREWLGYDRINLYGGSYGTRAALVYLRRHSETVRTMTIRGVMPTTGVFPLNNPADAQVSLEQVFADCESDPKCEAAFPEIRSQFAAVLSRLEMSPGSIRVFDRVTQDSVEIPITRDVFAGSMRRLLMDSGLQSEIPSIIDRAAAGDLSHLASGVSATLAVANGLYLGMGFSVICAEEFERIAAADIAAETAGTFLGAAQLQAIIGICRDWPRGSIPANFHEPVRADVPILLLSGALDPTTPARWGAEAADHLSNSVHLVQPGISHSPFSPCALGIMVEMIESGSVEGLDTSCVEGLERPAFDLGGM